MVLDPAIRRWDNVHFPLRLPRGFQHRCELRRVNQLCFAALGGIWQACEHLHVLGRHGSDRDGTLCATPPASSLWGLATGWARKSTPSRDIHSSHARRDHEVSQCWRWESSLPASCVSLGGYDVAKDDPNLADLNVPNLFYTNKGTEFYFWFCCGTNFNS